MAVSKHGSGGAVLGGVQGHGTELDGGWTEVGNGWTEVDGGWTEVGRRSGRPKAWWGRPQEGPGQPHVAWLRKVLKSCVEAGTPDFSET